MTPDTLDMRDVEVKTITAGNVGVKVTHTKLGISAEANGNGAILVRTRAIQALVDRINELEAALLEKIIQNRDTDVLMSSTVGSHPSMLFESSWLQMSEQEARLLDMILADKKDAVRQP